MSSLYFCFYFFYFAVSFLIAKRLRVWWILPYNSKVILTKGKHIPSRLERILLIAVCVLLAVFNIYRFINVPFLGLIPHVDFFVRHAQIFLITLLIWTVIIFQKKLTKSEISYLSSVNNLNLGYGTAIWYYKNYLYRILPDNFLAKVREYEEKEGVQLPHKLYILCPKSCKVKQYIDNTDYIEFSKDLPPYETDHGGIAGRKYSVSVYRIKYNGEIFRCALEYAQPLKNLLALKENGKISPTDMYVERDSFIKNLALLLEDHKDSFEACELVEFDDKTEELHEILSSLPTVQQFKEKTLEL